MTITWLDGPTTGSTLLAPPGRCAACDRVVYRPGADDRVEVTSPETAAQLLVPHVAGSDRERCVAALVDTKHRVLEVVVVSVGSLDHTFMAAGVRYVHPRRRGCGDFVTAVGIYTRLSQDREGQTSTSRQEADCRKLAEGRGWTVHRVYGDLDLSGYSGVSRPAFEELLEDLAAGTIVGVVSWKLDRLSRNRRDWNRLAELVDGGVKLACVQDPVDTTTTLGSVVVDLLASMARAESANTSTRVRSANLERAEAGKPHPSGQRAFGYTREWTIVRSEAAVLRKAADRLLSGDSLHAVCRDLNDRGVTTTGGNRWRGFTLSRTLRSPHVAGLRTHHGQVHPGTWTPILDRATWERLRAVLDRRGASHRGGGRLKHLLSGGVLVCGECGSTMTSRPREDKRLRYVCRQETGGAATWASSARRPRSSSATWYSKPSPARG